MARTRKATRALGAQLVELGLAAPAVIGHRMARMAAAGPRPSRRDAAEFARMSSEKWAAASESWAAMNRYAFTLNASATQAALAFWMPWAFAGARMPSLQDAWLQMASVGVRPYRQKTVANARRLNARTPR